MFQCTILRPIEDKPFSHRIWTKDNFKPSLDWNEILNRLLSITTADPQNGKYKVICRCGNDVFLTGGLGGLGFFVVKCDSCESEIMILDLIFKKENVHWISFMLFLNLNLWECSFLYLGLSERRKDR